MSKNINKKCNMNVNSLVNRSGWLCSDWDSRDSSDDFHDIETGKFMQALQDLSQLTRQLLEDSDKFIELNSNGEVVKEIHKRDLEFLDGHYIYRVDMQDEQDELIDENKFDKLLGLECNPDDVYSNPDMLVYGTISNDENSTSVTVDYCAPMDKWDLVLDETEYDHIKNEYEVSDSYHRHNKRTRVSVLNKLYDEYVYSADLFPKKQDKRLKRQLAIDMMKCIKESNVNGKALMEWTTDKVDTKVDEIEELTWKLYSGRHVCYGKRRVAVFNRRQELINKRIKAMARMKTFEVRDGEIKHKPSVNAVQNLSISEKGVLWGEWRVKRISKEGSLKATFSVYDKVISRKLLDRVNAGMMSRTFADKLHSERVKKLYNINVNGLLIEPVYSNKVVNL